MRLSVQTRSKGMGTGRLALAGGTEAISKFLAVVGEYLS